MFLQLTGTALYSVKPDRLLHKSPQKRWRLEVEGLDADQQSPTQRSADAELSLQAQNAS